MQKILHPYKVFFMFGSHKRKILFILLYVFFSIGISLSGYSQKRFQKKTNGSSELGGIEYFQKMDGTYLMINWLNVFPTPVDTLFETLTLDSLAKPLYRKIYHSQKITRIWRLAEVENSLSSIILATTGRINIGAQILLVKVDSLGDVIWNKEYGPSTFPGTMYLPVPDALLSTSKKENLVASHYPYLDSLTQTTDLFVFKTDSSGNLLWSKIYNTGWDHGSGDTYQMDMLETNDGGYLICSTTNDLNGTTHMDISILKTDSAGNPIWSKKYSGTKNELGVTVVKSGNNYFFAGYTSSFLPDTLYNDILVFKLDDNGNIEFAKTYGGSGLDYACRGKSIVINKDNTFVVSAASNSFNNAGFKFTPMLLKCDSSGKIQWARNYGDSTYQIFPGAQLTKTLYNDSYFLKSFSEPTPGNYVNYFIRTDENGYSGCNDKDVTSLMNETDITNLLNVSDDPVTVYNPNFLQFDSTISVITSTYPIINTICYCDLSARFTFTQQDSLLNFTDASSGAASRLWDFGDGSTSPDLNPEHIFVPGNFTVVLTIFDNGCQDTVQKHIIVVAPPLPPPDTIPKPITYSNLFYSGDNTGFIIKNLKPNSEFVIYDLLGRILFYSSDYKNNWGTQVAAGVYLYQLTFPQGEKQKGKLVLVK